MYEQLSFLFLWLCCIQLSAANSSPQKIVNIAHPSWGTTVTASSAYSSQHGAYNLTDNRFEKGNSWLSGDNVPYPQTVTFSFDQPCTLSQINLYQSSWIGSMYHTKEFFVEGSADGENFTVIARGELPDESNAKWNYKTGEEQYRKVRVVITSGYAPAQRCGLGEVQLLASVPRDREPLYNQISETIDWVTFRGRFQMTIGLEPTSGPWVFHREISDASPSGRYTSGDYELVITESSPDSLSRIIRWEIKRKGGQRDLV